MPDLESLDSLAGEVKRLVQRMADQYRYAYEHGGGHGGHLANAGATQRKLVAAIDRLRDAAAQRMQGHSTESAGQAVQRPAGEGQWIPVAQQLPEVGTECLVYITASPWAKEPYVWIDTWDEQHEAPLGFSSATIPIGVGWGDNEFEDVTHWQPLPKPPTPADASRATSEAGYLPQETNSGIGTQEGE